MVLDLKRDDHLRAMRDLLATADVFVYSVRPQSIAKLGLAPQDLAELNPKLITASLVGFGEDGPVRGPARLRGSDSRTHRCSVADDDSGIC